MRLQEIDQQIAHISGKLERAAQSDGDLAGLAEVGACLAYLRGEYQRAPQAFSERVSQLRGLGARFEELSAANVTRIVDRFHEVTERIHQAEAERQLWREALIRAGTTAGQDCLSGRLASVQIRTSSTNAVPRAGTPERTSLEGLIRESGYWEQVSQLSPTKLQRALAADQLHAPHADAIRRLCPAVTKHQVTSRLLGA